MFTAAISLGLDIRRVSLSDTVTPSRLAKRPDLAPLAPEIAAELPHDILLRVAWIVYHSADTRTLRALQTLSKDVYHLVTPILYQRVGISTERSEHFAIRDVPSSVSLAERVEEATESGQYFSLSRPAVRQLDALQHARHLTIKSLPSSAVGYFLHSTAQAYDASVSSGLFLPKLETIQILPKAMDDLREFTPENHSKPQHPFLASLSLSSRPKHLCVAFRLVPSVEWERLRADTTEGQYALVKRLSVLAGDTWQLETLTVHDAVHQVIPSLERAVNTVHFAPHVVLAEAVTQPGGSARGRRTSLFEAMTSPGTGVGRLPPSPTSPKSPSALKMQNPQLLADITYPSGTDATGIPGPHWNLRAWQIAESIKGLFPSSAMTSAKATVDNTIWKFVGIDNHVLTKSERDDDDDTGVGWTEVEELVKNNVLTGLTQDLPARHRFETALVEDLMQRVGYLTSEQAEDCMACKRSPTARAPVDPIVDTLTDKVFDTLEKAFPIWVDTLDALLVHLPRLR